MFNQALKDFKAGELEQAKNRLSEILLITPEHADALNLLGIIAYQNHAIHEAIAYLDKALQIDGKRSDFLNNLGNVYLATGNIDQAVELFNLAMDINPESAHTHLNLVSALKRQGKMAEADVHSSSAALLPDQPLKAHYQAAMSWMKLGRYDQSIKCFERLAVLQPESAEAHSNLGSIHQLDNNQEMAISCFQKALALQPNHVESLYNIGVVLQARQQYSAAIGYYQQVLQRSPEHLKALKNLANALLASRQIKESIACCLNALRLAPDDADLHTAYALALLLNGHLIEGWREFEWRRLSIDNLYTNSATHDKPRWHGENLKYTTILIYAEFGYGDTLQFVRYLPMLKDLDCESILLECQPPLKSLLANSFDSSIQVFEIGENLPAFDKHCPIISLAYEFGTTLETIPNALPYIKPDQDKIVKWRSKLGDSPCLRVGLTWAGNPHFVSDAQRSFDFSILSPLLEIQHVEFYSLQKDAAALQCQNIFDFTTELADFADTAALIFQLDLVISVDTAVAHLAAAMGKPVWLLSRFDGSWRWLEDRNDSPWYSTMRIFRQQQPNNWESVIKRVVSELEKLIS